ncbi:MAG: hypothetical protein ABIA78_04450 [archaeon]
MKSMVSKSGQIWVETVLYTLIALAMIAAVMVFAQPRIAEIRDKALIEQSIGILQDLDNLILSVQGVTGNQRAISLGIKAGILTIDSEEDKFIFEIESKHTYTEPCDPVQPCTDIMIGNIKVRTEKRGEYNLVTLTRDYSADYDIEYNEREILKALAKSSTLYKVVILNKGGEGRIKINIVTEGGGGST